MSYAARFCSENYCAFALKNTYGAQYWEIALRIDENGVHCRLSNQFSIFLGTRIQLFVALKEVRGAY